MLYVQAKEGELDSQMILIFLIYLSKIIRFCSRILYFDLKIPVL